MSKQVDLQALASTGQARVTVVPTKMELLEIAIRACRKIGHARLGTFSDVENPGLLICKVPTYGTVLQPAIEALGAAGYAMEPNVGSFLEATGIPFEDFHEALCDCNINVGLTMSGLRTAARLTRISERIRAQSVH
jgi:hypothetical protein